ncbi:molybdopterin-dependent oxidoreductase [Salinarchaeum sp. IM2453]|uniref:molybdopterin oxidoreductase family protein n=1 Tax=Salinarchaeum sp. IM2453 TaxID=2862870 RepID=UPI001C8306B3|nr:molybdopterin-dependent oxidoreductase [Salinarchaeum sp. IM2453]QZA89590.1 molybdopterin-dependent oxidoreductase [Salinarchaeum sp. IM2453]
MSDTDRQSSTAKLSRRDALKISGVTGLAGVIGGRALVESRSAEDTGEQNGELVKTICNHCAVGCGLKVEVADGQIVGQESWDNHPINEGGLCAKGSATAQSAQSPNRLKEPLYLEDGNWMQYDDWGDAISEVAQELDRIRDEYGPDSTMWMGSAKVNNEEAYLFRKLAAFYGTNNVDHQARICHSTTVAGLANTWGFGAQTQTVPDVKNADANLIIGHNPAESHPVAMRYIQETRQNGGEVIVAEPRRTKTAAHADEYVRFRPGTDIAFINGLLHHIVFNLNAHDEEFLSERVYDWETAKSNIEDYDLETVSDITGTSVSDLEATAEALADAETSTIEWSMGSTQHSNGTQNIRSYAILNLALGHSAQSGGGLNPFRGHSNVQGATDLCILSHSLPGYYGLDEDAWRHWTNVWNETPSTSGSITYSEMRERFYNEEFMHKEGLTVSRWYEGALDDDTRKSDLHQPEQVRAVVVWGHSMESLSELKRVKQALENVELVVVVDPFPASAGVLGEREDGVIMLPASTQVETPGSVTNTNRSVQWRFETVPEPAHNARHDWQIMVDLADELGFGEHFDYEEIEDVTREYNLGMRTIGQIGQTPARLKRQAEQSEVFSSEDLQADVPDDHELAGEYWGLPWPCWHEDHPGTPILYDDSKHPKDGGLDFRARWGVEDGDGTTLLRDSYEPSWWNEEIFGVPQYPNWHTVLPDGDNPAAKTIPIEYAESEQHSPYETAVELAEQGYDVDPGEYEEYDHSQPDPPTGRGRARATTPNLHDEVPVYREPIETPRPDLAEEYPSQDEITDHFRLDLDNRGNQQQFIEEEIDESYPLALTTGRQVEHQGGGATTRSTLGTASRAPMMYAEVNPTVANDLGVDTGDWVWVRTDPGSMLVQVKVTERVGEGTVFMPFHWSGLFEGKNITDRYPDDAQPRVVGDSANIGTSVGYDVETCMQATKATLCSVDVADDDEVPDLPEEQQQYQEYRYPRNER